MRVNATQKQYQQNFGMAFISNQKVNKAIQSRIKTEIDAVKLANVFAEQGKNKKLDIELFSDMNNNLSARIISNVPGGFEASYNEGIMASRFVSPIRFLEQLVNIVDKQSKFIHTT